VPLEESDVGELDTEAEVAELLFSEVLPSFELAEFGAEEEVE
jgi:hypothetical protein